MVSFRLTHALVYVGKFLIGGFGSPNPIKNENNKPITRPLNEP